ncbi:hypothetical protein C8F01DRAFT_1257555 [Mycena amicta]|nr:hypothetical protein C8F01DRAFT_1257555 [Mycena amicta]
MDSTASERAGITSEPFARLRRPHSLPSNFLFPADKAQSCVDTQDPTASHSHHMELPLCPLTPFPMLLSLQLHASDANPIASSNERPRQAHLQVKTFKLQVFCKLTVFFNFAGSFGRPSFHNTRRPARAQTGTGEAGGWKTRDVECTPEVPSANSVLHSCIHFRSNFAQAKYDLSTSSPDMTNKSEEAADKCGEPRERLRQTQRMSAISRRMPRRELAEKALGARSSDATMPSTPNTLSLSYIRYPIVWTPI